MANKTFMDLPAAGALTGAELLMVAQPSTTVVKTGTTLSALASDNSYNDSGSGFVTAGFAVGDRVKVSGFATSANNILVGIVTAVTAGKLTIGGTDGDVIVNESAGATVTIAKWTGRRVSAAKPENIIIAASDETTALTTGTAKVTFRMPYAMTLTDVRASLTTAQTSGSIFTVDVNEGGTTILSTKLTIDNTEKTSTTAATPRVISDAALADDAEITVDIDQIGDGTAKGLKVVLIGTRT